MNCVDGFYRLSSSHGWCSSLGQLTRTRLKELLHYDAKTGEFFWRVNRAKLGAGETAGKTKSDGYRYIGIDGKIYAAYRLAFLWMTGVVPDGIIDHKNRNKSDDSWDNLRVATVAQNQFNTGPKSNNKTGFKGVDWVGRHGVFRASIRDGGKKIQIGTFKTAEEASDAYQARAAIIHGRFASHLS